MTWSRTGKTYASAFEVREENPKRMLFLVHREQISKQAIAGYKRVWGNTKTLGLLSGNEKDYDVDYLFATMQTMAKGEILHRFVLPGTDKAAVRMYWKLDVPVREGIYDYITEEKS